MLGTGCSDQDMHLDTKFVLGNLMPEDVSYWNTVCLQLYLFPSPTCPPALLFIVESIVVFIEFFVEKKGGYKVLW